MSSVLIVLIVCTIICVVVIGAIIAVTFFMLHKKTKREEELKKRLPDVAYTEIVSSSNGAYGSITTYNSHGETSFGSFGSGPTTKFLIVYKSGEKQIVNLGDGSALFNAYVQLLKK